MSRRTIFSAGSGALEAAARRIPLAGSQQAQRSFSATAQRNAHIVQFTPSSSPQLDTLLSEIRNKIILPSFLTLAQRKKLFSPRYEKELQLDPIVIEIDGEVLKFRHLNPFNGDIPSTRKSVLGALKQFSTDADFANLRPLLEGINNTNRKLDVRFLATVVRLLGEKGRVHDIIENARRAEHTGLRLNSSEAVNELLYYVQLKAIESNWSKSTTQQALRWADLVVEMLDDPLHETKNRVPGQILLSRDPQVLMAQLHLASALVVKCNVQDNEALLATIHEHAKAIVQLWPVGKGLRELHPAAAYADFENMGYLLAGGKFLNMTAPLLHGLQLASQAVKDASLAQELQARRDILAAEIQAIRKEVADGKFKAQKGEAMYEKLFGNKN
ncbi:hypothetical protein BX600DRAFT_79587 [Xylariales sp. PMI_506]|nr:hypothetical protein BX600DRAFT_79587 [Xylariales sp. PMI_506]